MHAHAYVSGETYAATEININNQQYYNIQTGDYEITDLAGGEYFIALNWMGAELHLSSGYYFINPGSQLQVDFILEGRKGNISGSVKDNLSQPVSNCYLRMIKILEFNSVITKYTTDVFRSDTNGNFNLETFYGDYTIIASRTNENLDDPSNAEMSNSVSINETPTNIDLILP
ncbi:MAG: hypothetical protein ACP5Q5_10765 [Brevinematia bacterium]